MLSLLNRERIFLVLLAFVPKKFLIPLETQCQFVISISRGNDQSVAKLSGAPIHLRAFNKSLSLTRAKHRTEMTSSWSEIREIDRSYYIRSTFFRRIFTAD